MTDTQPAGTPAADDQRRCPVIDFRFGQCELYDGHLNRDDPADRHRTGSVLWADDAQRTAAPSLTSFAGAVPDLTGGMDAVEYVRQIRDEDAAQPAPEPAGDGPGWERESITELARRARPDGDGLPGYPALSPADGAQLSALLAAHDRQAHVAANLFALAEQRFQALEKASAERDAARRQAQAAERDSLAILDQRDAARAELAEVHADRERLQSWLAESNRKVVELRTGLATAGRAADALAHEAAQLARGDTWADTFGRWTADQAEAAGAQKQLMVDRLLDAANKLRRPVPGSLQPAGGEEGE